MIKNLVINFAISSNYITHHLKHLVINLINFKLLNNINNYSNIKFLTVNVDSFLISIWLAFIFLYIFKYFLSTLKYNQIPNKVQLLFELIIVFVLENVKNIIGKKDKYIFSLAFTVFTWILIMNLMSLIPIDIIPILLNFFINIYSFRVVATSDINVTSSLAFSSLLYVFIYKIFRNGFYNLIYNFLFHPFNNKYCIILNIILEFINICSKFLSLSLRLFGNMYSGEIIFILLSFIIPWWLQWLIIFPWFMLHIFISFLQSFIFMILVIIYSV